MKIVVAIIKPFKLDAIRDALISTGVHGLTLTEVRGYGRQKGCTSTSGGAENAVSSVPKLKIEVVVPDDQEEKIVEIIARATKPGTLAPQRGRPIRGEEMRRPWGVYKGQP